MYLGLQPTDLVPASPVPTKVSAYRIQLPSGDKVVLYLSTPSGVTLGYMNLEATRQLGEALVKLGAETLIVTPDLMVNGRKPKL